MTKTLTADDLFPKQRTKRTFALTPYVSDHAANVAHMAQIGGDKREPIPFRSWLASQLPHGSHSQTGVRWWWRRQQLIRCLNVGDLVVLIGPTRSGKTRLLSSLRRRGVAALDDTVLIDRESVLRTIDGLTIDKRGCALAFQSVDDFRQFEISAHIAQHRVRFLHFPER